MKKVVSLMIPAILICLIFTGCGKDKKNADSAAFDRILYKNGLERYVTLGDYKGITVDTASDEYKATYDTITASDVSDNNFYSEDPITEGKVQNNDIANIDYEGKKDGVAFDGGTAQGYDLTIGSGTFIPGFESGLIGKEIGSTVDLNLTFPENYGSAELAGQAVVFTVKINSVKRQLKPEEYYSTLGFKTFDEYKEDIQNRAVKQYLLDTVKNNAKIKSYPKTDLDYLYAEQKSQMESTLQQQYNVDFASYLQYLGKTEEDFKKEMSDYLKSEMDLQMVEYAIFDKEKLSTENNNAKTWNEESEAIEEAVTEFLYNNAQIK